MESLKRRVSTRSASRERGPLGVSARLSCLMSVSHWYGKERNRTVSHSGHEIRVRVGGRNVWVSRQCRGYGGNPYGHDIYYLVKYVDGHISLLLLTG